MAAAQQTLLFPGLVILTVLQLSSELYVRRGSDITDCSMKCPRADGVLQLYRECGGDVTPLLVLSCSEGDLLKQSEWYHNYFQPRLLDNRNTGCWSLRDAGKNDSCVYIVVYDNGTRSLKTLPVTVLDPEFSVSFPGAYVTIGIVFTVVVITCIALLVKCWCCKKTEDMERRPEETGGRISSSQTDRPGEKSLLIRIRKIWGRIRGNPEYEETLQRDVEMTDDHSVPAAETGRGTL
ncbi:uncharacterized protein [Ranitomeya imitator]|uniref:uncharacterized protein n=1 Tax=Ranitomeya imitator TaxID=111125 RepID=UPI0037E7910C